MRCMTSMQRVEATIKGEAPDRLPSVLYFQSAAQHSAMRDDVSWHELLNVPSKLIRNVLQQNTRYGADNLFLPLDFRVTGEAFGSTCEYVLKCGFGMRMPVVKRRVLGSKDGIDGLEVPDPSSGRGGVIIEAIHMLNKRCGGTVPIIGFLNSPADAATDILEGDYSSVLPLMVTDKAAVHKLFGKITEYNIEFGKAMLDAGAFALATVSGGFNDLTLSPEQYREFIAPYHALIVKGTDAPYCYHQCQDATPFLDDMVATGCGTISFSEQVDLAAVKRRYGPKVILASGPGVSTDSSIMCSGTPMDVQEAAFKAISAAGDDGRFWLSAGCEVHHTVPEGNILALTSSPMIYATQRRKG